MNSQQQRQVDQEQRMDRLARDLMESFLKGSAGLEVLPLKQNIMEGFTVRIVPDVANAGVVITGERPIVGPVGS